MESDIMMLNVQDMPLVFFMITIMKKNVVSTYSFVYFILQILFSLSNQWSDRQNIII